MILALLFALTLLVMLLPLLPALHEWIRPSDVVPLQIDERDALDPPFLANSFAARIDDALRQNASHLGDSVLVRFVAPHSTAALPLMEQEISARRSERLWHITGDATLPVQMGFYAEVASSAMLTTAEQGVYRALWAAGTLQLTVRTTVLRWAHGLKVRVAEGCQLAGRLTAQEWLGVAPGVKFKLLHAPLIQFADRLPRPARQAEQCSAIISWPSHVQWDAIVGRGIARDALLIDALTSWIGDLVCLDDLRVGIHCRVDGSLKTRGSLTLADGCHVSGNLISEGPIHLGSDCVVGGAVVSETAVYLGAGCTIGAAGRLATVAAPHIQVAPGVCVHGTLWAEEAGQTLPLASIEAAALAMPPVPLTI
jgi:cytoskeletal protein CcmA (bactofilin family)